MLFLPEDGNIHTNRAFIAGGYSIRSSSKGLDNLKIIKSKKFFFSYQADEENSFLGLHTPIKMYPEAVSYTHLDVYKRQIDVSFITGNLF